VSAERRKHSDGFLHLLDFFGGEITPTEKCLLLGFLQGHGSKDTTPPVSSQKPLYFFRRLLQKITGGIFQDNIDTIVISLSSAGAPFVERG
jgi:hypothetical protein